MNIDKKELFQNLQDLFSSLEQQKIALDESAIVAITDMKGDITYVNDKFCAISKYSKEELIGQNHRIINSGYHPQSFFVDLWKTIGNGKIWSGEVKNKAKDGSYYWVSTTIVPYLDQKGKPYQYVAIRFDITKQKEGEEILKQQKEALDESAIVAITDMKGDITYVNDKFCAISKYSKEELIGQNHRIINSGYHPQSFFVDLWKTISSGKTWTGEVKNKAKDGSYYWVSTTIVPYLDQKGRPYQYVAIRFDITKQKKLDEDLQGRTKQLEDFCYIISHNLRSPLSNTMMLLSMIEDSDSVEEQQLLLEKMTHSVELMNETFNELVESLQVQADVEIKKDLINFNDCYLKTMEILNSGLPIPDFEVEVDFNEVPTIVYPKKYIDSILYNLLSNAIRYRCPNKKLIIKIRTYIENNSIILEVMDNGIGIDMERNGGKLFGLRKTFHTHPDSKGFGLFITKTQVETMGGTIYAKSKLGEGTSFLVKLN